jgi:hypothetical protein
MSQKEDIDFDEIARQQEEKLEEYSNHDDKIVYKWESIENEDKIPMKELKPIAIRLRNAYIKRRKEHGHLSDNDVRSFLVAEDLDFARFQRAYSRDAKSMFNALTDRTRPNEFIVDIFEMMEIGRCQEEGTLSRDLAEKQFLELMKSKSKKK